jgi:hypothetical protein
MKDPREAIANHLTAHGVQMDVIGSRRTNNLSEILQGCDYAMLLGLIEPRQAAMLMAKYLGDELEERKARAWWLMECIEYASAKGWKRPKARMIEGMAYASLDEHLGHGTRCGVCHGTKERIIDNRPVLCPGCGGAGFVSYDSDRYSDAIGCTALEWDKVWRARVGWARRSLYRWEQSAVDDLLRRHGP